MVFWLYGSDRDDRGGGGRHCVLYNYVRGDSLDVLGYEDLPWILQVMFTLKRVRMVRRMRKMAVTMVSVDGDGQGISNVFSVVLSLRGP